MWRQESTLIRGGEYGQNFVDVNLRSLLSTAWQGASTVTDDLGFQHSFRILSIHSSTGKRKSFQNVRWEKEASGT